jgi:hypothetical protein
MTVAGSASQEGNASIALLTWQAPERGHRDGYPTTEEHARLAQALEERHAR